MEVDATDRRIVAALLADGRADPAEIAADVGIPVPAVEQRLDELERASVVEGYEPRLDFDALGFDVTAILRIATERDATGDLPKRLAARDPIVSVYAVTGADDLVAVGRFADVSALHETVGDVSATPGVAGVQTDVVRETVREGDHPPLAEASGEAVLEE